MNAPITGGIVGVADADVELKVEDVEVEEVVLTGAVEELIAETDTDVVELTVDELVELDGINE